MQPPGWCGGEMEGGVELRAPRGEVGRHPAALRGPAASLLTLLPPKVPTC